MKLRLRDIEDMMSKCGIINLSSRRRQQRESGEATLGEEVAKTFSELIIDLNHQRLEAQIIPSRRNKKKSTFIVGGPRSPNHREDLNMIQGEKRGTTIRLPAPMDAMLSYCSCQS